MLLLCLHRTKRHQLSQLNFLLQDTTICTDICTHTCTIVHTTNTQHSSEKCQTPARPLKIRRQDLRSSSMLCCAHINHGILLMQHSSSKEPTSMIDLQPRRSSSNIAVLHARHHEIVKKLRTARVVFAMLSEASAKAMLRATIDRWSDEAGRSIELIKKV